jgi:hypothetical protein
MKRRLVASISVLCLSLAMVILFAPSPSAVSNWEMGDLSQVAQCLGVDSTSGVYDVSEILCAIAERLDCSCQEACFVEFENQVDVYRGNVATLTVLTQPNSNCTIAVYLPSGNKSGASGLGPKTASASGVVTWSWLVGGNTGPGTGTIYVTSSMPDGDSCTESVNWEVRQK